MANLQEIQKFCNEWFKNYKEWGEEVNRKGSAYADNEKFKRIEEKLQKELKDQILKDLSVWELNWKGEVVLVPGVPVSLEDGIKFSEIDQKEIICAFIEEIKKTPQDWEIEIEKEDSDYQIVKHKSGRKHYRGYQGYSWRPGFSDEEWKEVENALSNQEQKPEIPTNPERQNQQEQPPKEINYMGSIYCRDK